MSRRMRFETVQAAGIRVMLDYEPARHRMVEAQIAQRGVRDSRVLTAMRKIPRERFVGAAFRPHAYDDRPLPIGHGQTISQPYMVARMAEAARLRPTDRVLEIGTGSGYATAVLSALAAEVFSIERQEELAREAEARLQELGCVNVALRTGDGSRGWPGKAPFDAIIVAAVAAAVPLPLQEELEIGGRLIIPIGEEGKVQRLLRITHIAANRYEEEDLGAVKFVPLVQDAED